MTKLFAKAKPSILGIAVVAVLSIAGVATANRAIRDNTVNTRDIRNNQVNTKDLRNNSITTRDIRNNQVNTRDLRDGAIRGVDIRDGSLELSDLSGEVSALSGAAVLLDPRAHDQDSDGNGAIDNPGGAVGGHACCVSWAQGPASIAETTSTSTNPLPGVGSGRRWRSVVLEPGSYIVQSTGRVEKGAAGATGAATRFFLGGAPLKDGAGYVFYEASALPSSESYSTAIEVGAGSPGERQLIQQVTSLDEAAVFSDNLLIWRVAPR